MMRELNWNVIEGRFDRTEKAAQALRRPKSRISRAISKLEYEVGAQLIRRTTRKISPTSQGLEFFKAIGPLINGIQSEMTALRNSQDEMVGTLRVTAPQDLGQNIVTKIISKFIKILKVDSLTGSGSTAIAHLGYHTVTPADENNLVGDHLTSGTFPAAYYNFPATQGGGLKHYQTQTVDVSGEYTSVTFSNLPEGMYKWFIKGWKAVGCDAAASEGGTLQSSSAQGGPRMYLFDQNGNTISGNSRLKWDHLYYDGDYNSSDGNASYVYLDTGNGQDNLFVGEFYTAEPTVAYRNPCFGFHRGTAGGASYNRQRGAWSLQGFDTTSEYFHRVHGIQFRVDYLQLTYLYFLEAGLKIELYRYDET